MSRGAITQAIAAKVSWIEEQFPPGASSWVAGQVGVPCGGGGAWALGLGTSSGTFKRHDGTDGSMWERMRKVGPA